MLLCFLLENLKLHSGSHTHTHTHTHLPVRMDTGVSTAISVHIVYISLQTYVGIMPSVCLEQPQRLHILYSYSIVFV